MVIFNLQKIAIANKIRNDPFYRFQSLREIEVAAELGIKIDVNQASIDDWLRLPGISIHQAKTLVELVRRGVHLVCLEDIAAIVNLPVARLLPLEPILQFAYYDRISVLSPQKINLNQASLKEVLQIPLWDESLGSLVISEREAKGKYLNFADLQSRLNLDNELISKLIYYVRLE
jgi:DNA uptake protein ComE-like DNA-binding protein